MCIILVVVNYEPKEIYERFERRLRNSLMKNENSSNEDQREFIKLLERADLINEKKRRKMNSPNHGCTALILKEIDTTPFPDEKFHRLLFVMKEFDHGLKTLAQKIEANLDPGINA